MRVVVTGASGNIGTALLRRFGADDNVERITGIARRPPAVAETWPRRGVGTSPYSRDKVAVEDLLDEVEAAHPELRVVRIRPPAVIQPAAAGALVRMMLGRLAPLARLTGGRLPVLPLPARAVVQLVAADDVAALIGAALAARAAGAFNVADDPVLPPAVLARLLGGRHVPAPAWVARSLLQAGWLARLVPLDGSWLDLLLGCPLVDTTRARAELCWRPRHDARLTLADVRRAAAARGSGIGSPALRWSTLGAGRAGPQR
jgi:UDP-glucose 4-epimerase